MASILLHSLCTRSESTQKKTGAQTMSVFLKDLLLGVALVCLLLIFTGLTQAADVVPTGMQIPGTQPQQVGKP